MSTYVLMRILESAPRRYDRGMRVLTLGRLDRTYDAVAAMIPPGERVLDIGCGTGALTVRAAERGARVTAIDVNPEMLAIARNRIEELGLSDRVTLLEKGVAELDGVPDESFDTVTAGLSLSELSPDELRWTLDQVRRVLVPGGRLLVADETRPGNVFARVLHALTRAPLVAVTYLLTQQTTKALSDLPARLSEAGLTLVSADSNWRQTFTTFVAQKPTSDEGPR